MSLTVKHLNADSSFLLTFDPASPFPPTSPCRAKNSYTILIDPWLVGPSKIWLSRFSTSRHMAPPCINSLTELPEPNLVIISQSKSDHCHRETLTQLPPRGGKTIILAEPAAAKVIRSWKHFDPEKVVTLHKWEDRKLAAIHRIPIPALAPDGTDGEVTVTFLTEKGDITKLHSAVGITYRSPTVPEAISHFPDTPPLTPKSFQTTFSHVTNYTPNPTLSVLYSPHGISYKAISSYVSYHLVPISALPLTSLLHPFNRVRNVWYLGGTICSGFPGGLELAQNLCARAWISAHDGEKELKGIANGKIEIKRWEREEVENVVSPRSEKFPHRRTGTEAVVLSVGEEIRLSNAMQFGPQPEGEFEMGVKANANDKENDKKSTLESSSSTITTNSSATAAQ